MNTLKSKEFVKKVLVATTFVAFPLAISNVYADTSGQALKLFEYVNSEKTPPVLQQSSGQGTGSELFKKYVETPAQGGSATDLYQWGTSEQPAQQPPVQGTGSELFKKYVETPAQGSATNLYQWGASEQPAQQPPGQGTGSELFAEIIGK